MMRLVVVSAAVVVMATAVAAGFAFGVVLELRRYER
jgi:hypothetical protein